VKHLVFERSRSECCRLGPVAYGYEISRHVHQRQTSVRRVVQYVWSACSGAVVPFRSPCRRVLGCYVLVRNCASLGTIQRSIELLYYRTGVPSNERLVREANVNATVAERGGRPRTIRNRGPRDAWRGKAQPNPRTLTAAPGAGPSGGGRPNHLRLVADHGRVIDPAFIPRQSARPTGSVPNEAAGNAARAGAAAPRAGAAAPQREARAAVRGQGLTGRGRASRGRAARRREVTGRRPVRLTRRGRFVITSMIVLLIAVASMVLASAAQAAGHP
jgi:hypothetical protein